MERRNSQDGITKQHAWAASSDFHHLPPFLVSSAHAGTELKSGKAGRYFRRPETISRGPVGRKYVQQLQLRAVSDRPSAAQRWLSGAFGNVLNDVHRITDRQH